MKLRMTEAFRMVTTCEECGRDFDLLDEEQAEDWGYGHDCIAQNEEARG